MFLTATARRATLLALILALALVFLLALRLGALALPWGKLIAALPLPAIGDPAALTAAERTVLVDIRLPRAVAATVMGAVLGLCGAAMQGLFRNALADPGLVGVTSGASLGSVLYLKLAATSLAGVSAALGSFALPLCAFAAGLAVTAIMHGCAQVGGRTVVALMLLAGIAINALGGAAVGLVLFFSDDDLIRQFILWTLGSVGHATWPRLAAAAPLLLAALIFILRDARALNALLLGEAEAGHLGIDLQRLKRRLVFLTAAGAGAVASVVGGIGFVGLVAPHLARTLLGADHRWLVPGAALLGAIQLLGADLLARTLAAPAELPTGILTAIIGAPVFFSLLQSHRRDLAA